MANSNSDGIGKAIKSYFMLHGIQMQDVAKELGITKQSVTNMLSGNCNIGRNRARKLHELYGFNETFLLTGSGNLVDEEPEAETVTVQPGTDGIWIPRETVQMFDNMAKTIRLLSEMVSDEKKGRIARRRKKIFS